MPLECRRPGADTCVSGADFCLESGSFVQWTGDFISGMFAEIGGVTMAYGSALETARTLREQHSVLNREFHQMLNGSMLRQRRASDLQAMAAWAVRAGQSGWALIRHGTLRATNRALDLLDRDSDVGPRWHPLPAGAWVTTSEGPGASLREILLEETRQMLKDQASVRTSRYARGERAVEITVECSPTAPREEGLVLGIVRDLSELATAEARLTAMRERLTQKERASIAGELAIGVAHDLGNLVGALSARLMVLESQPETLVDSLAAMRAIVDAQVELVTRLKASGTRHHEDPEPLDLFADVLKPATHMVGSWLQLRDRQRPVWIHLDEALANLPRVSAARDELVNVVINLLLNARDAMPEGGSIRLHGGVDAGQVCLWVQDEGPGVPEAIREHIFEAFYSTKGRAGTGMGLATAKEVMRRLCGDISVRNLPEGGACFELRFPLVEQASAAQSRALTA
jgi:signal transduction histidine kinase